MRLIHSAEEVEEAYTTAKSESLSSFGDDTVYLEKFVEEPHHIEFQILGDKHGNVIHLCERECSVQRRNQKIVEETPSVSSLRNCGKIWGKSRGSRQSSKLYRSGNHRISC